LPSFSFRQFYQAVLGSFCCFGFSLKISHLRPSV
jgi:hypothetical protein